MEAGISGGAARDLLRIVEVKGEEANSTKKQLSPEVFLNGAFISKVSFSKQAFQMIVKTIWQSEELLFLLVLDFPDRQLLFLL